MKNKKVVAIFLFSAFILSALVYWDISREKVDQGALEKQIEGYKATIEQYESRNDSLRAVNDSIRGNIKTLESKLDSNNQALTNAKNQLYYERRKFKEYTDAQKDSILDAFIRNHQ